MVGVTPTFAAEMAFVTTSRAQAPAATILLGCRIPSILAQRSTEAVASSSVGLAFSPSSVVIDHNTALETAVSSTLRSKAASTANLRLPSSQGWTPIPFVVGFLFQALDSIRA